MPATTPLFIEDDLAIPMGRGVTTDEAEHAERIVWGWLQESLGLAERPAETPDNIWAWAVELGTIYLMNPAGLSRRQLGTSMQEFSSERRGEILAEAADGTATSTARPRGSFPPAPCYPDPAW